MYGIIIVAAAAQHIVLLALCVVFSAAN